MNALQILSLRGVFGRLLWPFCDWSVVCEWVVFHSRAAAYRNSSGKQVLLVEMDTHENDEIYPFFSLAELRLERKWQ